MKQWLAFITLALFWGSSFMWIKIALEDIQPLMLVLLRLAFAVLGMVILVIALRIRPSRDLRDWLKMTFVGIVGVAAPFVLITIAEKSIPSSLAALLNAAVPLFTLIIAALVLPEERITVGRLLGLGLGFAGVLLLLSKDLNPNDLLNGSVFGQGLMLLATFFYAVSTVFNRRFLGHMSPLAQTFGVLIAAEATLLIATPALERPLTLPTQPITWLALAWLGILGAAFAYVLFFYLLREWGPTRATLVTYVVPVVGLILGVAILNETLTWQLVAGGLLILTGIVVVNWPNLRQLAQSQSAAASD